MLGTLIRKGREVEIEAREGEQLTILYVADVYLGAIGRNGLWYEVHDLMFPDLLAAVNFLVNHCFESELMAVAGCTLSEAGRGV